MRPKDYEAWLEHVMKEYRKEKKRYMAQFLSSKKYKKYIIGKIERDEKGNESIVYLLNHIEEAEYEKQNKVDMSKLSVIRDLIVIYLADENGRYQLDKRWNRFVYSEEE